MSVKVAVVTGGNKGIGFAIVKALCEKFKGHVYLTARDETRGLAAVERLEKEGLNPKFHVLDIEQIDSIKAFASYIKNTYDGIDVLVNNAAIAYKVADTTPFSEQAEVTVRVNFFGTLNVCRELFPLLKSHARVVNISSSAGKLSNIPNRAFQDKFLDPELTEEKLSELMRDFVKDAKAGCYIMRGWSRSAYQVSKIGVSALSFLQNKNFAKSSEVEDVVVNAVHPGYVDTDMTSHKGELTPEQGAEAPVFLALLPPNIDSPRGEFVWYDKKVVPWLD